MLEIHIGLGRFELVARACIEMPGLSLPLRKLMRATGPKGGRVCWTDWLVAIRMLRPSPTILAACWWKISLGGVEHFFAHNRLYLIHGWHAHEDEGWRGDGGVARDASHRRGYAASPQAAQFPYAAWSDPGGCHAGCGDVGAERVERLCGGESGQSWSQRLRDRP